MRFPHVDINASMAESYRQRYRSGSCSGSKRAWGGLSGPIPLACGGLAHLPQKSRPTLARSLRQSHGKQRFSRSTCQSDKGTRWVTAKEGICASDLTADQLAEVAGPRKLFLAIFRRIAEFRLAGPRGESGVSRVFGHRFNRSGANGRRIVCREATKPIRTASRRVAGPFWCQNSWKKELHLERRTFKMCKLVARLRSQSAAAAKVKWEIPGQ